MNSTSRCPLRSTWLLGLAIVAILSIASVALSDEPVAVLEGSRQTATVLSAGGHMGSGGRLMGTTVLGEEVSSGPLRGGNFIINPGFLAKKKLLGPPSAGVDEPAGAPTAASRLIGNRPNPFNPSTAVHFDLGQAGTASLKIYDVRGRLVRTLVNAPVGAGRHQVTWDGRNDAGRPVASGVYLLEMSAGDYRGKHKMILAR